MRHSSANGGLLMLQARALAVIPRMGNPGPSHVAHQGDGIAGAACQQTVLSSQ